MNAAEIWRCRNCDGVFYTDDDCNCGSSNWDHALSQSELIEAGFVILPRSEVEAIREALERSIVAIDDWLHQYASDMCSEDHVKATGRRIFENGGTLAYIADVQEKNRAALRKLKSGGE